MTELQKYFFASALFLVGLTGAVLISLVRRRRSMPAARSFMLVVACGAIWSVADALFLLTAHPAFVPLAYVGVSVLPLGWLAFCLDYTGRSGVLTRTWLLVLAVIPVLTIPIVTSNDLHHWMWENLVVDGKIKVRYGIWHSLSVGYSYLLFAWGYMVLLFNLSESVGAHRRRLLLILLAGAVPWVVDLLQVVEIYPRWAPNPTPLAFVFSCLVFFFGLFRLQLLEVLPVAQRVVINQMPDALLVLDATNRVISLNPAAEDLLGVRLGQAAGLGLAALAPDWRALDAAVTVGEPIQQELARERPGKTRYYDLRGALIRDGDGRKAGVFCILRDVTEDKVRVLERERLLREVQATNDRLQQEMAERRRVASELRQAEESWRTFCENSPIGIYRTTPDGRILMANPALLKMLGYQKFEQLAKHNLEQEGYEPRYDRKRFKELLEHDGQIVAWESQWRRRDGSAIWVREHAQVVRDGEGNVLHYDGTIEDISTEKRAEEERQALENQMQQVQKLESLGVLAGGIAHDFNNILMVILGNADLASEEVPPAGPARDALREIRQGSLRAAELCQKLLAYAGRAPIAVGPVHLPDLVQDMAPLLRSTVSKKASLRLDLPVGIPPIRGDGAQLQQVVLNLVTNASESLGEREGDILVTVGCSSIKRETLREFYLGEHLDEGRYVWLHVADHGCGMDAATLRRVFEPFFTTKVAGRGLGLSAILGIVRGHHGAIRIVSELEHGTTVRVVFPALKDSGPVEPVSTWRPVASTWRGRGRVLLVDDEEAVRRVGGRMLESLGFTVATAADGQEAMERYQEADSGFELVLLDEIMPRKDGSETLAALRQVNPAVRVLRMSGYNEAKMAAGPDGKSGGRFLQKPFTKEALAAALRATLEEHP